MSDFGVYDSGEIALGVEKVSLSRPVEIGGVDRSREIGDEHPVVGNIERNADPLHQVRQYDLRQVTRLVLHVDRRAIDRIAARRIAAIGPIEEAIFQIELEIDWFRQTI